MTDKFDGVKDVGDPDNPKYVQPTGDEDTEYLDPAPQQDKVQQEQPKEETPQKPEVGEIQPEKDGEGSESKPDLKKLAKVQEEVGETRSVDGETPKERALRAKLQATERIIREFKAREIIGDPQPVTRKQMPEGAAKRLEKYRAEDVETFKDIFSAVAEEYGLVSRSEIDVRTKQQELQQSLDSFLELHSEYQKDPVLWDALKDEVGLYKTATSGKELKRILDKAHNSVYGIRPASDLKKVEAKQEKIKVASHQGQGPKGGVNPRQKAIDPNLRNNLKGFTDEELEEIFGDK